MTYDVNLIVYVEGHGSTSGGHGVAALETSDAGQRTGSPPGSCHLFIFSST